MISLAQKEIAVSFYRIYNNYSETVGRLNAIGINISESGVRKIVIRSIQTGNVRDRPRSGRPSTTTHGEDLYLRRRARRSRSKTLVELVKTLKDRSGTKISTYNVSRRLREMGFRRRVPVSSPLLTVLQKEKRHDFSNLYRKSRLNIWAKVIFSDEKMFQAGGLGPKGRVTRRASEKFLPECIREKPKRGVQVHVWGAIKWEGVGPFVRFKEI